MPNDKLKNKEKERLLEEDLNLLLDMQEDAMRRLNEKSRALKLEDIKQKMGG
ncbi:MAG: hypothetical protein ABSE18_01080 [Minisyncoccia bacterium]|jgi:hypothetical protein